MILFCSLRCSIISVTHFSFITVDYEENKGESLAAILPVATGQSGKHGWEAPLYRGENTSMGGHHQPKKTHFWDNLASFFFFYSRRKWTIFGCPDNWQWTNRQRWMENCKQISQFPVQHTWAWEAARTITRANPWGALACTHTIKRATESSESGQIQREREKNKTNIKSVSVCVCARAHHSGKCWEAFLIHSGQRTRSPL